MKTCSTCQQAKPYAEFSREPRMADGHRGQCKQCRNAQSAARRKPAPNVGKTFEAECKGCGKPFSYVYTTGGSTRRAYCGSDCRSRAWHVANGRSARLRDTYGITETEYQSILAAQGGGCAICGTLAGDVTGRHLHIDHDHKCCPGRASCGNCVRGLLCSACNIAIGALGDDSDRIRAAAVYVERPRQLRLA